MGQLTHDSTVTRLHARFAEINTPDGAFTDSLPSLAEFERAASAQVLSKIAEFLGEFSEFLPSRETFLAAASKAVDLAFEASGRPILTNLLKPAAKQLILSAAGSLYDSIALIGTESPEPRTEV